MEFDSSVLDRAICYAVNAHAGTARRVQGVPYILHPMEAVAIVATMTTDQNLMAAAVLHDIVEDTNTTVTDIEREFGKKIATLVENESDKCNDGIDGKHSWHERKQAAMKRLKQATVEEKMVALGDKLSNMRAIARDYAKIGNQIWQRFHVTESSEHEWHYRGLATALSELSDTFAYKEFTLLIEEVFCSKD